MSQGDFSEFRNCIVIRSGPRARRGGNAWKIEEVPKKDQIEGNAIFLRSTTYVIDKGGKRRIVSEQLQLWPGARFTDASAKVEIAGDDKTIP